MNAQRSSNNFQPAMHNVVSNRVLLPQNTRLPLHLLAVLGSQSIVVNHTVAICFDTVNYAMNLFIVRNVLTVETSTSICQISNINGHPFNGF